MSVQLAYKQLEAL